MFKISGQITNTFTIPKSEKYDESFKVQLLGDQTTKDGQVRKEMVTLNVPENVYQQLTSKVGQPVELPVGLFVSNGRLQVFFNQKTKTA